jgi:amino acid transporter
VSSVQVEQCLLESLEFGGVARRVSRWWPPRAGAPGRDARSIESAGQEGRLELQSEQKSAHLREAMSLRDVVLFFVTTGTNLQWVALAAAAGPSSLVVWLMGALAMFFPLSFCVLHLSARFPDEGGLYAWTRRAFGHPAGFLAGWMYWCSNLPYFPGLLYFTASNALFVFGDRFDHLQTSSAYFIGASIFGLVLGAGLNVLGLGVGKWLNNLGGITRWLATLILIGLGVAAWASHGSATTWTWSGLLPTLSLTELVFWSTIAFAWTGPEAASFMGEEIKDARRTVPRALLLAAPMIATIYVLGTISVLVAVPTSEVSGLQGIMQAIRAAEARLGFSGIAPLAAALVTLTSLGSVGAWFEAVARIPFVAGIDRFLPESFGRLHPRWGSPYVALLTQAGITVLFVLMGQAGTSVRGAYQVLVSLTVLVTLLPFLLLFAAAIRLSSASEPPGTFHLPGGRRAVVACAILGLFTTVFAICLTLVPAESEPNKPLAVAKVVGATLAVLGSGAVVYFLGRQRGVTARTVPPERPD